MENNQETVQGNAQMPVQGQVQTGQPVNNAQQTTNQQPPQAGQSTPAPNPMGFGVTTETRTGSIVPLPAPVKLPAPTPVFTTGFSFPIANIVKISSNQAKEITRNGVKEVTQSLEFLFKDAKGRQFTHIEYPIDMTKEKAKEMVQWLNERVMHFWDQLLGMQRFPQNGIGTTAQTFGEYFQQVAEAFNAVTYLDGDKTKVLYPTIPVYVKLTYNQDRLQLPMFPNFIQKATDANGQPRPQEILSINVSHDKIEATERKKANNPYTTGGGTNAEFGGSPAGNDYSAFPEV